MVIRFAGYYLSETYVIGMCLGLIGDGVACGCLGRG